jgi:hypothetical protein
MAGKQTCRHDKAGSQGNAGITGMQEGQDRQGKAGTAREAGQGKETGQGMLRKERKARQDEKGRQGMAHRQDKAARYIKENCVQS